MSVETASAATNADNTYSVEVVGKAPTTPQSTAGTSSAETGVTFHNVLSALNPLQYVPVVGTIYRAITGDSVSEPVRELGSLAFSGLTGGPIGLAINIGVFAAEKLTGIDPEAIGQHLLADLGLTGGKTADGSATAATVTPSAPNATASASDGGSAGTVTLSAGVLTTTATATAPATPTAALDNGRAWSASELAAYGVKQAVDGTLTQGAVSGADVLNGLMLQRLSQGQPALQTAA